jgi:hypothetical protein
MTTRKRRKFPEKSADQLARSETQKVANSRSFLIFSGGEESFEDVEEEEEEEEINGSNEEKSKKSKTRKLTAKRKTTTPRKLNAEEEKVAKYPRKGSEN